VRNQLDFGRFAVTAEYDENCYPDGQEERGARVEVRRLRDGELAEPVWRADLFRREGSPPGIYERAHFHPHFDGWTPAPRHWTPHLRSDPVGWAAAQVADIETLLSAAGASDLLEGHPPAGYQSAAADIRSMIQTAMFPPEVASAGDRALIPIQHGAGPPLFFITTGAAALDGLRETYARLLPAVPISAMPARAWAERHRLFSIVGLAEDLVEELRSFDGPYRLAGYSLGGLVAFEAARRLREAGEEVPLLLLIDGVCYRGLDRAFRLRQARRRARGRVLGWLPPGLRMWLRSVRDRARGYPYGRGPSSGGVTLGGVSPPGSRVPSRTSVERMVMGFRPGRYAGPVVLMRTTSTASRWESDSLGWERFIRNGPEVEEIPGTHGLLHREPEAVPVARAIARRLARFDRRP
jgi:thioesterase domain-containing protein